MGRDGMERDRTGPDRTGLCAMRQDWDVDKQRGRGWDQENVTDGIKWYKEKAVTENEMDECRD